MNEQSLSEPTFAQITVGVEFKYFDCIQTLKYLRQLRQRRRCGTGRVPTSGIGNLPDYVFGSNADRECDVPAVEEVFSRGRPNAQAALLRKGLPLFVDASQELKPYQMLQLHSEYPLFPIAEITRNPHTKEISCVLFRVKRSVKPATHCWHCAGPIAPTAGDAYGGFPCIIDRDKQNIYQGKGFFCTIPCVFAFIQSESVSRQERMQMQRLTREFMRRKYRATESMMVPAPGRSSLEEFGGYLSRDQFRRICQHTSSIVKVEDLKDNVDFVQRFPRAVVSKKVDVPNCTPAPQMVDERTLMYIKRRRHAAYMRAHAKPRPKSSNTVQRVSRGGARWLPTWSRRQAANAAQEKARQAHMNIRRVQNNEVERTKAVEAAKLAEKQATEAELRVQPKQPVLHRPSPKGLPTRNSMSAFLTSNVPI